MKVHDIIPNLTTLKVVLVLESPFKDEVIHKHPLAGSSGQIVTKYIKNKVSKDSIIRKFTLPLGRELKHLPNSKLGIMNCSLFPLEWGVYTDVQLQRYSKIIRTFKTIRGAKYFQRHRAFANDVENRLIKNFRKRMSIFNHVNQQITFVPCGDLAEKFLDAIVISSQHRRINKIPHPSGRNGGWTKLNDKAFNEVLIDL